ncbi:site-specific integrase [Microlunatus speluncae]|uniref:site-specific integrase n=1 Tax=Microlunatus speluncae TaxID=2594267 RepID=UPI001266743B|nr:site-specific integrase [Microlunatus speluncae]
MTRKVPPLGVAVHCDIFERSGPRGIRFRARARWTDPTGKRDGTTETFATRDGAQAWCDQMAQVAATGIDTGQTLADYIGSIGDRWLRTVDPTSTADPYRAGINLRVKRDLGHIGVGMITAGLVDRIIDRWEVECGRSTVKNTVAALVLVLDEAVRDELLKRNPARDRARRKTVGRQPDDDVANPRDLALPDVETLNRLADAAVKKGQHKCWGDVVVILATTAMRISEVAGLLVGDIDLDQGIVPVVRQTYPGRGGLVTKATKGRRTRDVPIIDPLRSTLERLTFGRPADARLLVGPRGGVITTATLRDATDWDTLVTNLGFPGLVRHGLRHTALTWMADSGIELDILQRVAGHSDPAITARYLHPDRARLARAGAQYAAWWAQNGYKPDPNTPSNVIPLASRKRG